VKLHQLKVLDINLKYLLKNIETFVYDSKFFWNPYIYIVNAVSVREEISYKIRVVPKKMDFFKHRHDLDLKNPSAFVEHLTVMVTQTRRVRGIFHETLELHKFPTGNLEFIVFSQE
jgi:hypothetical protein